MALELLLMKVKKLTYSMSMPWRHVGRVRYSSIHS
jgi:hypothetical protein